MSPSIGPFNDKKNRDESLFLWFCGENKGTQIFDKQKSAGRLIKISFQKFDQVSANASLSEAWADEKSYPAKEDDATE